MITLISTTVMSNDGFTNQYFCHWVEPRTHALRCCVLITNPVSIKSLFVLSRVNRSGLKGHVPGPV